MTTSKMLAVIFTLAIAFSDFDLYGEFNQDGFAAVLAPSGRVLRDKPSANEILIIVSHGTIDGETIPLS